MNKGFEEKLNIKKAPRGKRGFSLIETLMTILILLLVSSCAAMAISFGTVEYRKSMNQSLAQMLYSTIETSVESQLQYADHENIEYVLQDGMLYLNTVSGLKPVLEKAAYTNLNLKDFNLNYNAGKHFYTVSFSVCAGDDVLIDGDKYSFDVLSLTSMLGFRPSTDPDFPDVDPTPPIVPAAQIMSNLLNQNIYAINSDFHWYGKDGWNNGNHSVKSIGKALVSGAQGKVVQDAFATLGSASDAAKYYGLISNVNFVSSKTALCNELWTLSEAGLKYKKSTGAFAIMYCTKDNYDELGKNGVYEVTEYVVAECNRKVDDPDKQIYGETGYTVIGVRETEIRTDGSGKVIITLDDYDVNNWTPVPAVTR